MATNPRQATALNDLPVKVGPRANDAIKSIVKAMGEAEGDGGGKKRRAAIWGDADILLNEIKRLEQSIFLGANAVGLLKERDEKIAQQVAAITRLEAGLKNRETIIASLRKSGGTSQGVLIMGPQMDAFLRGYQDICQAHGMKFDLGSVPKLVEVTSAKELRKDMDDVRKKLGATPEVPAAGEGD